MYVDFSRTFRSAAIPAKITRNAVIAGASCGVLLMTAACGSQAASAAGTPAAVAAAASPSATSMAAYLTCLRQHGAAVPTARPTARPTVMPTARPTAKAAGHVGTDSKLPAAARTACASLRPAGGTRGGTRDAAAVKAFDACMTAQGETIPTTTKPTAKPMATPSAKPTGTDRFLHGLNPANAKVAAALKACESKLPTRATAAA